MTIADRRFLDQLLTESPAASTIGRLAMFRDVLGNLGQPGIEITLTEAIRGQARADIGADSLAGDRNLIINGNFDVWQRALSQTASGYGSDDRWNNFNSGSTKTHSRQAFTPGQTDVPGNPKYFSRTVVTSVAGASNYVQKQQKIEDVTQFSSSRVTLTFYAKADTAKNIAVEFVQLFGTGGSPSGSVTGIGAQLVPLTTAWQRKSIVVDIPSVTGKIFGTDNNDSLAVNFWFDAGSTFSARTASLSQQSGTFDITHVSLVRGDASAEADPFPRQSFSRTLSACQRFYEKSYSLSVFPGTISSPGAMTIDGAYTSTVANRAGGTAFFKTQKRDRASTVTIYSTATGASGKIGAGWVGIDIDASLASVGEGSFYWYGTLPSAGNIQFNIHWTAENEI